MLRVVFCSAAVLATVKTMLYCEQVHEKCISCDLEFIQVKCEGLIIAKTMEKLAILAGSVQQTTILKGA